MKPRLNRIKGLWYCLNLGDVAGIGYTPQEAYNDWLRTKIWVKA